MLFPKVSKIIHSLFLHVDAWGVAVTYTKPCSHMNAVRVLAIKWSLVLSTSIITTSMLHVISYSYMTTGTKLIEHGLQEIG